MEIAPQLARAVLANDQLVGIARATRSLDNAVSHGEAAVKVVGAEGHAMFSGNADGVLEHAAGVQDSLLGAALRLDSVPRGGATQSQAGHDLIGAVAANLRGIADTFEPLAGGRSGASLDWTAVSARIADARRQLAAITAGAGDVLASDRDAAMQAQMLDILR
jgi:hypothetical protein